VRPVPIAVSDESQRAGHDLGANAARPSQLVPSLLQVQAAIAFAEPRQKRAGCTARELYPGEMKEQDKKVAAGVLGFLLLIPLAALAVITAPLWLGGSVKFN
jgi:hypothetical protein